MRQRVHAPSSLSLASQAVAGARLRLHVKAVLWQALKESGLTQTALAKRLGLAKSGVSAVLHGSGNVQPATLAAYLWAMGFRLEIRLVPLGVDDGAFEEQLAQALSTLDTGEEESS